MAVMSLLSGHVATRCLTIVFEEDNVDPRHIRSVSSFYYEGENLNLEITEVKS